MAWDVIVVGGGNAALCAALAAREHCDKVLVLERASEDESGGNSHMLMMDRNNLEVAALIQRWLEQQGLYR